MHQSLSLGKLLIAPFVLCALLYFPTNWGKLYRPLVGPTVPANIGWMLFEGPNLFWAAFCFLNRDRQIFTVTNGILLSLFAAHYINRAVVYPLTLSTGTKRMPVETVLSAFIYTNFNGYLQSRSLCRFQTFPSNYMTSPYFLCGCVLFLVGVRVNLQSDAILRSLRKGTNKIDSSPSGTAETRKGNYKIPHGGFFEYVSAPHYFGEILEWGGFALACGSLCGLSFFVFTCANLIPRGLDHHKWYLKNFDDYPRSRTGVIPFLF